MTTARVCRAGAVSPPERTISRPFSVRPRIRRAVPGRRAVEVPRYAAPGECVVRLVADDGPWGRQPHVDARGDDLRRPGARGTR